MKMGILSGFVKSVILDIPAEENTATLPEQQCCPVGLTQLLKQQNTLVFDFKGLFLHRVLTVHDLNQNGLYQGHKLLFSIPVLSKSNYTNFFDDDKIIS